MKSSVRLLALAALAGSSCAMAVPLQWTVASGGNGHWYEYIAGAPTWEAALAAAAAQSHLGMTGHLATITSSAENSFINSIPGGLGWVAGTDRDVEGTWIWAAGPEAGTTFWQDGNTLTYAAWNGGEPNNVGNEDYLVIRQLAGWNDAPTSYAGAYYVEYSAPIPEPGTWALMAAGLLGLASRVRRRTA
jgi:PEP-CTERM motif/Lectin C-type domain